MSATMMRKKKDRAIRRAERDARLQKMRNSIRIYQVARATYGDRRPVWSMTLAEFLTAPRPISPVCEPTKGGLYQ